MASHEGSRKRLKISRSEGRPKLNNTVATASSSAPAKAMATNGDSLTNPSPAEQALKTLNTDIDAMRQLVTCKICDRLLYEPYALSCGHTYCYSCLSQWLVSNKKKTCPDCRAVISQQPTPSYIVRELVLVFIGRNELLPEGETSDEHVTLARAEAKIVTDDRANADARTGGLFKGCFTRNGRARLLPLHDPGDGVERCPECHWELEDGFCNQCGIHVDGEDLYDDSWEDDTDLEVSDDGFDYTGAIPGIDGEDDYFGGDDFEGDNSTVADGERPRPALVGVVGNRPPRTLARWRHRHRANPIDIGSSSDEDSEDDEVDETMQGFVVSDDNIDRPSSDEGEATDVPEVVRDRSAGRQRAPVVVISDDDDDEGETAPPTAAEEGSDGHESEEEAGPVARASRKRERVALRSRRALPTSDEEHESSDDESSIHAVGERVVGGFSPLDESAVNDLDHHSEFDSDRPSSGFATYGNTTEDDEESEGDGDDECEYGWGMPAETPRDPRQLPPARTHRLGNFAQRSNRRASPPSDRPLQFQRHPTMRPDQPNPRAFASARPPSLASTRRPLHPFQLSDTLVNVNYNHRNQQMRSNTDQHMPPGNSRSSSGGYDGGVGVGSSGSSGSSATIRPNDEVRRKRALSISSDLSYESHQW